LAPFPATNAWNIVWIAIEGWRTDAFNAEITPRMQRFAAQCLTGTRHYSSGNTTRFGIFGMFYGLHGFYWHPFLVERQGPVLFKALKGMGYDIRAMGSANFNNPEFRLTCFVDLAPEEIRDGFTGTSCDRDAAMAAAFHEFLEQRDSRQPFFCFMFFDAPHAYHFRARPGFTPPLPIEDVPFVSYQRLAHDPEERRKAHQRYQNAQAYVDFLVGGILDDLAVRQVLTNTIVMISGDHGEEFGESGYYGHNSAFDDWQTCTPFVFYYPGAPAGQIDKLISHADWLPTAMHLLGSRQSPADYCQGLDILSAERRDYVVSSSWSQAAIITAEGRLVFPFEAYRLATADIYDAQGRPIMERDAFLARYGFALREVLESTRTFKQ
jgi:membrane-anchored protein YejM (alkaline phosphatase superfamily)